PAHYPLSLRPAAHSRRGYRTAGAGGARGRRNPHAVVDVSLPAARGAPHHRAGFVKPPAADPALLEKLVLANRVLYRYGVVDGFGHVSARHTASSAHFLLSRNMAPALVRREDIVTFDLDGAA